MSQNWRLNYLHLNPDLTYLTYYPVRWGDRIALTDLTASVSEFPGIVDPFSTYLLTWRPGCRRGDGSTSESLWPTRGVIGGQRNGGIDK